MSFYSVGVGKNIVEIGNVEQPVLKLSSLSTLSNTFLFSKLRLTQEELW